MSPPILLHVSASRKQEGRSYETVEYYVRSSSLDEAVNRFQESNPDGWVVDSVSIPAPGDDVRLSAANLSAILGDGAVQELS